LRQSSSGPQSSQFIRAFEQALFGISGFGFELEPSLAIMFSELGTAREHGATLIRSELSPISDHALSHCLFRTLLSPAFFIGSAQMFLESQFSLVNSHTWILCTHIVNISSVGIVTHNVCIMWKVTGSQKEKGKEMEAIMVLIAISLIVPMLAIAMSDCWRD
jgi:hypothetical protein